MRPAAISKSCEKQQLLFPPLKSGHHEKERMEGKILQSSRHIHSHAHHIQPCTVCVYIYSHSLCTLITKFSQFPSLFPAGVTIGKLIKRFAISIRVSCLFMAENEICRPAAADEFFFSAHSVFRSSYSNKKKSLIPVSHSHTDTIHTSVQHSQHHRSHHLSSKAIHFGTMPDAAASAMHLRNLTGL